MMVLSLIVSACDWSRHAASLDAEVMALLARMAIQDGDSYESFYLAEALRKEFHGSRSEPLEPRYRLGFSIRESKQSSLLTSGGVPSFHVLVWHVSYHITETETGELVFQGSYQQQGTIDDPLQPLMMVTSMDHLRRQLGTVVASLIRARVVLYFHDQIHASKGRRHG
jgi:hypothetical protein